MNNKTAQILLIEDNPGDARLIKEMLGELPDAQFQLDVATRLSAGLESIAQKEFDVILLDLGLPDSQGLETLARVNALAPAAPIVVLTGLDDETLALEAVRQGAQDYLVKRQIAGRSLWRVIRYAEERQQAEEALWGSERRLKEAQALGKIGSWEFDLATQKIEWSDQVYVLYQRDKALGPLSEEEEARYYSPGEAARLREFSRLAIEKGEEFNYDLTARLPSGKTVIFNASMRPIKDRKGRVIKLFGTVQDVTERKLLEQQVLNSEKLAAIGELAAGVAHEINNPLQGVTGYAQLLDDRKDLPDDVRDDLHRIYNESQRAVRIVQNLLRFASQQKPAKTALDINEVIKGALELRAYELRTEDIKVSLQLEPGLPWVVADYGQMQQVIINIVTNAEQALFSMKRKGNITIKTEKANNVVRISIADNGPGIPAEYLDRVFDPFFTTKEVGSGSGLGLSMCHGIVTEHGGTILAQSQAGQGATFIIELPLVAEEQGEEQAEIVEERTPRRSKKASGTILIVDDEESIRNILTRVLSQEGYQADTAVSGKAALKKLAQRAYDLLILDFKMPDMGGRELYGNLKVKYPEMADKVLFSTGDTMTGETHTFITSTGRPFLSKPFNHQELLKLVEETIG